MIETVNHEIQNMKMQLINSFIKHNDNMLERAWNLDKLLEH
jgi:hypothetical protein